MHLPLLNDFEKCFNDDLWIEVAQHLLDKSGLSSDGLRRVPEGENIVFLLGDTHVLKIFTPQRNGFNRERAGLEFAAGRTSLKVPEIIDEGEIEGFYYLVTSQIKGEIMTRENWLKLEQADQIRIVTQLASGLKKLHSYNADDLEFKWGEFMKIQRQYAVDRQVETGASREWIESLPRYVEDNFHLLPDVERPAFLHGDIHFANMKVMQVDGEWQIAGVFDFADSLAGFHEYDFLAPGVLMIQGQGDLQREFFRAYGYPDADINEELRRRLMLLTILYECSNLKKYAIRLRPEAVDYTLEELEKAIWNFV